MANIIVLMAMALLAAAWLLGRRLERLQGRVSQLSHGLEDALIDRQQKKIGAAAALEQQKLVEKSVETGAASAETIHKAVSGATFGILDSISATRGVSRMVREVHDGIAGSVYATVRGANKQIGEITKEYLSEQQEKEKSAKQDASGSAGDDSGDKKP